MLSWLIKKTPFKKVTPINWLDLVPEEPSFEQFDEAWIKIFDYKFEECEVNVIGDVSFQVKTSNSSCFHGGFGEHIYEPTLKDPDDIYYEGCGCTWGTDLNGIRYHKVDETTGLPVKFNEVKSVEIIRRYIKQNRHILLNQL